MRETGEPPAPEAARGVLARLAAREETLAVAESCTGGGLGRALTSISGASEVFVGGVIAYSDDLKVRLLEVPESIISLHGAVSKQCAVAMARGAREVTGADWGVSVTGIAGPGGGSEEKPVGTVWLGISGPKLEVGELVLLTGDRALVRSTAVDAALDLLARSMEERDV